jgi:hypothetical protein
VKAKVTIMNDRVIPMTLKVQSSDKDAWDHEYHKLAPAQGKTVEYEIPENSSPYLKIWENNVALLSYIPNDVDFKENV